MWPPHSRQSSHREGVGRAFDPTATIDHLET